MKNSMIVVVKCYRGSSTAPGDKTLDSPLRLSQLAARELFLAFPFFLSHSNIIFPPKVKSAITVNACQQLHILIIAVSLSQHVLCRRFYAV